MDSSSADYARRLTYFIGEGEEEDGFSGNYSYQNGFSARSSSLYPYYSPIRSAGGGGVRFHDLRFEDDNHQYHFLNYCFLCKKPLGGNRDIFMYRGDTPFCSEECREKQIQEDETKDKKWNLSASFEALRKKEQKKKSSAAPQDIAVCTGTIAAAS